jgi:2-polyprenyl-6-methoxyphenol hydroxylase-like FAD-dependent oxidoreductase
MAGVGTCDLLIGGGGLAGAALGAAMAVAGKRVVIVEKETAFRDRVRGEILLPWGSAEAKALGIYDLLLRSCAREVPEERFSVGGGAGEPRDYRSTTPSECCSLSFYHPEMQEHLLAHAAATGAVVRRGATIRALRSAAPRDAGMEADLDTADGPVTLTARLVVGADGRESRVASLLGFERQRDPTELIIAGLQFASPDAAGGSEVPNALHLALAEAPGLGAILLPNKPGNFRAYLMHHKDALPRRLSGARDYPEVLAQFAVVGWPREWLALRPHGIFASFDGAHQWVTHPARGAGVLIGDAAGSSDPVWGNGLARTLRDVRLLRDRLLETADWSRAIEAYAADHDDFFHRLRRIERLSARLHFAVDDGAPSRRRRAHDLMARQPELSPDMSGLGPEARWSAENEALLLGTN